MRFNNYRHLANSNDFNDLQKHNNINDLQEHNNIKGLVIPQQFHIVILHLMISTTYALFDTNREFLNDFNDLAKT